MPYAEKSGRTMRIFCISLALWLSACANCRTVQTDPTKTSTGEMLFCKDELDTHLRKRREFMIQLETVITNLDSELLTSQSTLFKIKSRLNTLELPIQELNKLRSDIHALEKEQDQLEYQIIDSKEQISRLEQSVDRSKAANRELDRKIAEERQKADNMQKKLDIVKNGIKRAAALSMQE